jgi:hypothetical protein
MRNNNTLSQSMILDFNLKTIENFKFLEKNFGFRREDIKIAQGDYFPDSMVEVRYFSKKVTVIITWYFAGAMIDVTFVENEGGKYPDKISFIEKEGYARAIDIYSLIKYMAPKDMDQFILKDIGSMSISSIKKRENLINKDIGKILNNLSVCVKNYAIDILNGDTSRFSGVQTFGSDLS